MATLAFKIPVNVYNICLQSSYFLNVSDSSTCFQATQICYNINLTMYFFTLIKALTTTTSFQDRQECDQESRRAIKGTQRIVSKYQTVMPTRIVSKEQHIMPTRVFTISTRIQFWNNIIKDICIIVHTNIFMNQGCLNP